MIDSKTLEIYYRHKGNPDALDRGGLKEGIDVKSSDWYKIDRLVGELYLVKNDLTSPEMAKRVLDKLEEEFETDRQRDLIYALVEDMKKKNSSAKSWWKFW